MDRRKTRLMEHAMGVQKCAVKGASQLPEALRLRLHACASCWLPAPPALLQQLLQWPLYAGLPASAWQLAWPSLQLRAQPLQRQRE